MELTLALDDFDKYALESWQQLWYEKDFSDMILACDDKEIKVHRTIIASSSPILKTILNTSNSHPFVYLEGVRYEELVTLVNFIYQGEVNLGPEELQNFLSIAENLQLEVPLITSQSKSILTQKKLNLPAKGKFREEYLNENLKSYERDIKTVENKNKHKKKLTPSKAKKSKQLTFLDNALRKELVQEKETFKEDENKLTKCIDNVSKQSIKCISGQNTDSIEENVLSKYNKVGLKQNENLIRDISKFACEQCEKSFAKKVHLGRHIAIKHLGIRYSCNICAYNATRKELLKSHKNAVHEGIRYPCPQCDYTSGFKNSITTHIKEKHNV